MNLVKWLKRNSDIKLGKLKIKKGDVIVVKGSPDMMNKNIKEEQLHKAFPDNLIIFIIGDMILEGLSEREMNEAGWIRK